MILPKDVASEFLDKSGLSITPALSVRLGGLFLLLLIFCFFLVFFFFNQDYSRHTEQVTDFPLCVLEQNVLNLNYNFTV